MSEDGIEFTSQEECARYESFFEKSKKVESLLLPHPDYNDGTSVQQKKENVLEYRNAIADMCNMYGFPGEHTEAFRVKNSFLLRILSDSSGPYANRLNNLAWRCQCIDKNFQEWGQPYFANLVGY